jgi:hypothetical protein
VNVHYCFPSRISNESTLVSKKIVHFSCFARQKYIFKNVYPSGIHFRLLAASGAQKYIIGEMKRQGAEAKDPAASVEDGDAEATNKKRLRMCDCESCGGKMVPRSTCSYHHNHPRNHATIPAVGEPEQNKQAEQTSACWCDQCNGKVVPKRLFYLHQSTRPVTSVDSTDRSRVCRFLVKALDNTLARKLSQGSLEDQVANHVATLPASDPTRSLYPKKFKAILEFIAEHTGMPMTNSIVYDVCPHDCILYFGPYADNTSCPHCGSHRVNKTVDPGARSYHYLPLIPRLKRMYGVPRFAELLGYVLQRVAEDGLIKDIQDGVRWKKGYLDTIGLSKYHGAFGLGADGITINERDQYSVVPILLTWFNLPPHLRKSWRFLMLSGLVPGPGSNNLETFLWPLKAEFELLGKNSLVHVYDAFKTSHHVFRSALISGVFDTRALPKAAKTNQSPGRVMCHRCDLTAQRGSGAPAYEEHLRNLPAGDPLRQKLHQQQLKKCTCTVDAGPCERKTPESVLKAAEESQQSELKVSHKKHPGKTNGIQGVPFLHGVLGWCICDSPEADIFHQETNDGLRNVLCMHGAKKPYIWANMRTLEQSRGRWQDVSALEQPPFQLRDAECSAIEFRTALVRPPRMLGARLPLLSQSKGLKQIKGHEWKLLLSDIGIYIFADAFVDRPAYRQLWFDRCRNWKSLTAQVQRRSDLPVQQLQWQHLGARGEDLLPTCCSSSTNHFNQHMVNTIESLGVVRAHWMYGEERFGERLVKQSHTSTAKEAGIVAMYQASELLTLVRVQHPDWCDDSKELDGDGSSFAVVQVGPESWRRSQGNMKKERVLTLAEVMELESLCESQLSTEATTRIIVTAPRRVFRGCPIGAPTHLDQLKFQSHIVEYQPLQAVPGCEVGGLQYGLILEIVDARRLGQETRSPPILFMKLAPLPVRLPSQGDGSDVPVPLPLVAAPAAGGQWVLASRIRADTTALVCPALALVQGTYTHFLLRL